MRKKGLGASPSKSIFFLLLTVCIIASYIKKWNGIQILLLNTHSKNNIVY